ncbi:E3 ubiquitin-protein ligase MARCH2-like [Anoplophora glabripennis]|uniref:E3 ubiquitin-protein ligase MARCH2-like n=1 Tax=Anoplophora glabripennis TaxID=217634 RepID=UPI0008756C9B|nr:E3 ubiquitin-protein ligase MARCH2-like [Anoplophora glabripennis]
MSDDIQPALSAENLRVSDNKSSRTLSYAMSKESLEKSSKNVHSVGSISCRICHTNTVNEGLISPCNCKGSLAYVHLSCLERWLNQSSRSYCELCLYQYNATSTKRYKLCEGFWLWIGHPRNRMHFKSDLLIAVTLTLVTIGLIVSCAMGMEYFLIEGKKIGLQKNWMKAIIVIFLVVVGMGYAVTIYLIIKDQFLPWFRWWKNTVDIHLLLPTSVISEIKRKHERILETQI